MIIAWILMFLLSLLLLMVIVGLILESLGFDIGDVILDYSLLGLLILISVVGITFPIFLLITLGRIL